MVLFKGLVLTILMSGSSFATEMECVKSDTRYKPLALNGYPYPLGAAAMSREDLELFVHTRV